MKKAILLSVCAIGLWAVCNGITWLWATTAVYANLVIICTAYNAMQKN